MCEIVGKPQLRFQTAVIPDTLDPVWNKRGELDYAKGDSIKLTVLDRDPGSVQNHDVLGHVTLTSWRLQPHGFEGEAALGAFGESAFWGRDVDRLMPGVPTGRSSMIMTKVYGAAAEWP